jgi:hypothetical protein
MTNPPIRWVRRADWHAKQPRSLTQRHRAVVGVTFHHTTGATFGPPDRLDDWVRAIQAYHMSGQHEGTAYADIAYNALVGFDGSIFEGRANWAVGAHARSHGNEANQSHLGVAYLGMGDQLTPAARFAFQAYVYVATLEFRRPLHVATHFDWEAKGGTSTECCGHGALAHAARDLSRA